MKNALWTCLLLAIITAPVYAQSGANQQGGMRCPMMTEAADIQKQMGAMMTDMRSIMDGASDPSVKARMQMMHERMSAMMANMQKMHAPAGETAKGAEPPTMPPPASGKEDHEAHHPGQ